MSNSEHHDDGPSPLSPPPRTRRRDFRASKRSSLKGRSLLLQDSDEEEGPAAAQQSESASAMTMPVISFQDIMSNLVLEEKSVKTSSAERSDALSPSREERRSATTTTIMNGTMPLSPHRNNTEDGSSRRRSVTPSISSALSNRRSTESPLRTPLMQGSFVSLIDAQGLAQEDLDMLKLLKRRQAILRELVTTELSFSTDLAVVVQEYQRNAQSCPGLNAEDVRRIFGGVEPVMAFSNDLAYDLQLTAAPVLFSEAQQMQTLHHEDSRTAVGAVFSQYASRLSKVFARYCSTHESAAACLQTVSKDPTVQTWLADRHPTDRTTAWDLPSLLIKPVQRVMKYPLLLSALLEATPRSHLDYGAIDAALKEMLFTAENINNIKKRRDLVGQIAADRRKSDGGVLTKTFQRRSNRMRMSSTFPTDESAPGIDSTCDHLVGAFKAQETVLQTLRLEIQEWLQAMTAALDYHMGLSSAFEEVLLCDALSSSDSVNWQQYGEMISNLRQGALVQLTHKLEKDVFSDLTAMERAYEAPGRVLARREDKKDDYARFLAGKNKGLAIDRNCSESADEYLQLNDTLLQELPVFLAINKRAMNLVIRRLSMVQTEWYRAWHTGFERLIASDVNQGTLLEHYRYRYALLISSISSLDLINGNLAAGIRLDPRNLRSSEDSSSASEISSKVTSLSSRPTVRNRALSVASSAATSLKQMTFARTPSGSTTPTLISTRASYGSFT